METVLAIVAVTAFILLFTYRGRAILGGVFYAFSEEKRQDFARADSLERQLKDAGAAEDDALDRRWNSPSALRPHSFEARKRDPLFASRSRFPMDVCAACGRRQEAHRDNLSV
jgi:hypothetical protein